MLSLRESFDRQLLGSDNLQALHLTVEQYCVTGVQANKHYKEAPKLQWQILYNYTSVWITVTVFALHHICAQWESKMPVWHNYTTRGTNCISLKQIKQFTKKFWHGNYFKYIFWMLNLLCHPGAKEKILPEHLVLMLHQLFSYLLF